MLAHNYHKRGYYRDAIVFWEKLLSLGQQNENIYKKLGYNYYERGEIDHAIKNYLSALAYNANDPKTHMQLGRLYNRKKDFVNAKTHLQQAITLLNPSLRDPYYTMALTYRIKEKWNLALQYINLAIKEDPGFIQGYYVKAQIADQYYKDRAEVIACYDKVISLSEGNANWEYYKILSKERVSRIKEEIFLEKEAKE